VLAAAHPSASGTSGAAAAARPAAPATIDAALTSPLTGRIGEVVNPSGSATVQMSLGLQRGPLTRLVVELFGQAAPGGGVSLSRGQVALGAPGKAAAYRGAVSSLTGGRLTARLTGAGGVRPLTVALTLRIDRAAGQVTGTADLAPAAGG
jgi:hypothetical protein